LPSNTEWIIGTPEGTLSPSNKRASEGAGWGPWLRFYGLLLLIFFEVVVFVFQNIEKKRLGYELSVLVKHKRLMIETREQQNASLLEWERLDSAAERVRSASLELQPNRWPVAWVNVDD
jgi:hypothetical protein